MKKLRYLLLIVFIVFGFQANALRISHYEPTFQMDEEFNGEQLVMYFGFRGEEANISSFKIEYDAKYIDYVKTAAGDNIVDKTSLVSQVGNKKVHEFEFKANYISNESIFGAVVFKVNKGFNIGKNVEIKIYDIKASDDKGQKYRSEGYYINLKRESKTHMLAMRTDINDNVKKEKKLIKSLPFIAIGVVLIILIIVAILLVPAKASENRNSTIKAQLDPNNYPIPGVGPFPSIKKKTKRDIIEPEEKVIQPLSEFVSKSDEVNSELMNKGLEVDKEMFKSNPTKQGEQGLININPLAFDDGEEDVLDTSSSRDNDDNDIDTL